MTNPTRKDDPIEFTMGDYKELLGDHPNCDKLIEQLNAAVKQAREDTFNHLRDIFKHPNMDDRWTFLQHCLTGWAEGDTVGFVVVEYNAGLDNNDLRYLPGLPPDAERRPAHALVIENGDDYLSQYAVAQILEEGSVEYPVFKITHETIELGLQRIRHATNVPDNPDARGNWERDRTTIDGLHQPLRDLIIEADLNNDSANLDVWGFSAIIEVALLGEVRYC